MTDPTLTSIGPERMRVVVDLLRDHDPDVAAVFVLHGSPDRGLAASIWSPEEGEDAEHEVLALVGRTVLELLGPDD